MINGFATYLADLLILQILIARPYRKCDQEFTEVGLDTFQCLGSANQGVHDFAVVVLEDHTHQIRGNGSPFSFVRTAMGRSKEYDALGRSFDASSAGVTDLIFP